MGRSASSYARKKSKLIARAKVLIICEDSKSCKTYLIDATKYFNIDAEVEVAHVGKTDPKNIVLSAIEKKSNYQIVYCVIDRDSHETFDEAINLAKQHKNIEMVVSYPCFEYWLLLHFSYSRKAYAKNGDDSPGNQMCRSLKDCDGMESYEKGGVDKLFAGLLKRHPVAKKNSLNALNDAKKVGELNPSTRMHELFDEFEVLSNNR